MRAMPLPDLTLVVRDDPDGLFVNFEYNSELFADATIARWWGHFQVLLHAVAANPRGRIEQVPLLPPDERRRVLRDWNPSTGDGSASNT